MNRLLPALLALLSFLLPRPFWLQPQSPGAAQAMPPAAYKLIAVTVTGSKRFTSEEIAAASGLPVGTVAHEGDFKKAARQIGESGAFSNISFTYTYSSAGTKVLFQVTDAEKFVPVHFTDFVWFTEPDLLHKLHERIPLFNGELPATGRLTAEVSDVLQALLVENGVPGHVEYLRHSSSTGQLGSIDFNVAGVSIRIHHVDFPGAGAAELPLLEAAAEKMIDREYSRAYMSSFVEKSLLPIYHEHGYLKASCATAEPKVIKPPASDADNGPPRTYVDVTFPVTPGVQYRIAGWEWSGNKEVSTEALQPLIHAKAGQVANTVQLESDLRVVQELYGSKGYVLAGVKADAEFDNARATVTYHFAVNEGAQFHMGELEFRGLDNTLTARLRAAWKLHPGDVYDATYLKQYVPQSRKLLPVTLDWDIDPHVTAIAQNKTVDVDLQYTAKAPQ